MSQAQFRPVTRRIQMVFQDPFASLNPRRRAGDLIAQGPVIHGTPKAEALARAREMLALVGLDPAAADRFPHEFSGGQRQRIGLARALAMEPCVLVADEPVSALDVSVQAQVLRLLAELKQRLSLSLVFITHDLRVAAQICDRILVMHRGEVVEQGETATLFAAPQHPYTQGLLASTPRLDTAVGGSLPAIPGQPPNLQALPQGCVYAGRCPYTFDRCWPERPILRPAGPGRLKVCHLERLPEAVPLRPEGLA
jgi:peptide/nickel transport system ATP-binding protein